MSALVEPVAPGVSPEALVAALRRRSAPGIVLLRSAGFDIPEARYSFVTAFPFLSLRARGSDCDLTTSSGDRSTLFGNPWRLLDSLMARFELLDSVDLPFPLGGAFGYWGYGLRRFVEPKLGPGPTDDLEWPDAAVGFHDSLVIFDHRAARNWIVTTGLQADGSRAPSVARRQADRWRRVLEDAARRSEDVRDDLPRKGSTTGDTGIASAPSSEETAGETEPPFPRFDTGGGPESGSFQPALAFETATAARSKSSREEFCRAVDRARDYIRRGHVYQVNLAQRFDAPALESGWALFRRLCSSSPAPFGAYFEFGEFRLASVSPELFLRFSGSHVLTRPIKGTRPRSNDPTRDSQLAFELQTSPKELAELVMITDLLRNDLGRVCEFGSVRVPELLRLEKYAHVQHLVSTVEGRLRGGVTHLAALEAAFPGGSITGAPKFRAMEIIDELEPVARGPYTGCAGYLGFNRESQLSILIRTALVRGSRCHYSAGAGIVADSDPVAEYDETLVKAAAFLGAVRQPAALGNRTSPRP